MRSTVFEISIFLKHEEVCSPSMSGEQGQMRKTLQRKLEFLLQTKLSAPNVEGNHLLVIFFFDGGSWQTASCDG